MEQTAYQTQEKRSYAQLYYISMARSSRAGIARFGHAQVDNTSRSLPLSARIPQAMYGCISRERWIEAEGARQATLLREAGEEAEFGNAVMHYAWAKGTLFELRAVGDVQCSSRSSPR